MPAQRSKLEKPQRELRARLAKNLRSARGAASDQSARINFKGACETGDRVERDIDHLALDPLKVLK